MIPVELINSDSPLFEHNKSFFFSCHVNVLSFSCLPLNNLVLPRLHQRKMTIHVRKSLLKHGVDVWDRIFSCLMSCIPVKCPVSSCFRDFHSLNAKRKVLGKSYCRMKDNDMLIFKVPQGCGGCETASLRWGDSISSLWYSKELPDLSWKLPLSQSCNSVVKLF